MSLEKVDLFTYLFDMKICIIHKKPYGHQHIRYATFIANTSCSAILSLFIDIRRTSGDFIDRRSYLVSQQ